jgi:Holliday junction resolvase
MREQDMFDPMVRYLQSEGYNIVSESRGNKSGPDIIAEKDGEELVIEMKGDSLALKTDWDTGLGQLLQNMKNPSGRYAIAVSQSYRYLADRFPSFSKEKLGLIFFIVDDDGQVEKF